MCMIMHRMGVILRIRVHFYVQHLLAQKSTKNVFGMYCITSNDKKINNLIKLNKTINNYSV